MVKISTLIKILRPLNISQSAVAVLITAALFKIFPETYKILLTIITVGSFLGAGNAINDYFDLETDKINRPNLPIPSGLISHTGALYFSIILFIIGIISFLPIATFFSTILLIINLVLLIIYTPILKPTVFIGNATVSFLLGSTFLFGAEIFGDVKLGFVPTLLAFSFNLARELIKDIEDEHGDKQNNLKTLPVKYGKLFSKKIAGLLILLIIFGCYIPYFFGIYGKFYLITLIISVEIPLIFVLYLLYISSYTKDFTRISNIMKVLVFFGLLSIYLGKF